ncbi:predicted protein [Sclerotinia sclerotiorum 1980 UF-70]|uniref:Uncharacterized protein n=1 Tax=Sclerotinia sclerotiorum (strain ATCC 18683 / 1980 / Ss-1) TaxID=665079 RepID=A7E4D5_SCLS1|nr:predicted protein [Sclerotinia sclerotiorum 1980 UF-70]EDN90757.1 predicted protein [Sclerotinia sclerotiorum 1980 UF-70]
MNRVLQCDEDDDSENLGDDAVDAELSKLFDSSIQTNRDRVIELSDALKFSSKNKRNAKR